MASGYDKSPPEPPYESETESGVWLVLVGIAAVLLFASLGFFFTLNPA